MEIKKYFYYVNIAFNFISLHFSFFLFFSFNFRMLNSAERRGIQVDL